MTGLEGFWDDLARGTALTLLLALSALALGLLLAVLAGAGRAAPSAGLRLATRLYTDLFRGLPEFLTILIVYLGSSVVLTRVLYGVEGNVVDVSPFLAGVMALGLTFGAYGAEVVAGALRAVPRGQVEAARALGLSPVQVFVTVQAPEIWRLSLPGLGNLFLVLLKDTSLISLIGMNDLMRAATQAARFTRDPFTAYLAAAVIYLGLTLMITWGLKRLEARSNRGFT